MTRMNRGLLLGTLAVLFSSACGSYRVVKRLPHKSGEIALQGMTNKAREAAEQFLDQECPTGFDIEEEGEVVVGQSKRETKQTTGGSTWFGTPALKADKESEISEIREYRLKYKCRTGEGSN